MSLPKTIFWITAIILLFLSADAVLEKYYAAKEYSYYSQKAVQENNPVYCERIGNFRYAAQCYSYFVQQGHTCTTEPCYLAYALYIQDDWYCDTVFPESRLPLNMECRVSVFIERYTHEGLSDCCYIE